MPKISVVIPTHNRPKLLKRAIQSVLNQTYQDFEIIVVDDGISKRANNIVASFSDKRIQYIQHKISKGGGAARNSGIKNSQGNFIAFLDDDDEWLFNKLEKQIDAFNLFNDIDVVFCGVKAYDEKNKFLYKTLPNEEGIVFPFDRLLRKCYIWTSAIMLRNTLDNKYLFDENLKKNQEWDLLLRIARRGKFFAINEALTKLNILGDDDHMGGKGNIQNILDGYKMFLNKHYSDYIKKPKVLASRYFYIGTLYRDSNQLKEARLFWLKAWKLHVINLVYLRHILMSLFGSRLYYLIQHKIYKIRKNL